MSLFSEFHTLSSVKECQSTFGMCVQNSRVVFFNYYYYYYYYFLNLAGLPFSEPSIAVVPQTLKAADRSRAQSNEGCGPCGLFKGAH